MPDPFEILIVDSDSARRSRYGDVLSEAGYNVETVGSVASADEALADAGDALLVCSLLLDDGNAFDLARNWTRAGRLALGFSDVYMGETNRRFLAGDLGLAEVLEAPLEPAALLSRISALPLRARTAVTGSSVVDGTPSPTVPNALDPMAVPATGNLETHDVAAVLTHLAISRVNGALMLQADDTKKLVYFQDGLPVGVKSNMPDEFLGQMLVREGVVRPTDCERSVEEMRATGRRQGELLVEMGCLAPDQLEEALHRQFLMKFEEVLAWSGGMYRYKDAAVPGAYHSVGPVDMAQLVWYAIERMRPIERARQRLWPVDSFLVHWRGLGLEVNDLAYPDYATPLFERLTGEHTVNSVIDETPDPDHAALLLYALTAFGSLAYQSAQRGPG